MWHHLVTDFSAYVILCAFNMLIDKTVHLIQHAQWPHFMKTLHGGESSTTCFVSNCIVRGSDRIISVRGYVLGVTYLKINYMKIRKLYCTSKGG